MDNQLIRVKDIATTTQNVFLSVAVYFAGRNGGFTVVVTPTTVTDNGQCRSHMLFTEKRGQIESAARFNRKKLEALASTILGTDLCNGLVEAVRVQEGLTLAA